MIKKNIYPLKLENKKTVGITLINSGAFILIKEAVERVMLVKNIEFENY